MTPLGQVLSTSLLPAPPAQRVPAVAAACKINPQPSQKDPAGVDLGSWPPQNRLRPLMGGFHHPDPKNLRSGFLWGFSYEFDYLL